MLVGLVLLGFGALFLLGADGQLHRLVIAALGLVLGLAGMAAGVWLIQRALVTSPARVRGEIMEKYCSRWGFHLTILLKPLFSTVTLL